VADGSPVTATLTAFNEDAADALVDAEPAMFDATVREAERIRWVRTHVRAEATAAVEVGVVDRRAARLSLWTPVIDTEEPRSR